MTVYNLKLTTISPLFIGEGRELRQGFDFVMTKNHTYRIDEDAILSAKGDRLVQQRNGSYPLPGTLLTDEDLKNPALIAMYCGVRSNPEKRMHACRAASRMFMTGLISPVHRSKVPCALPWPGQAGKRRS